MVLSSSYLNLAYFLSRTSGPKAKKGVVDHNPQRLCCSGAYYSAVKRESQEEIFNFARFMNFPA
jgi:hypothetical protein